MTRSHVLPHCSNAKIRAARKEAWEGKNPGSVSVFLSNSRWGISLLRSLEPGQQGWTDGLFGRWRNGLYQEHQIDYLSPLVSFRFC
jgi:hypothetical protein